MEKEIEKLELHIVRLEQAIRQVQRLKRMGLADLMYPFSCVLWAIFWSFSLLFFVR